MASIDEARLASKLCACDLDQNTRSRTSSAGQIRSFRAVAQLGRALGSGRTNAQREDRFSPRRDRLRMFGNGAIDP
jgi:hypothetical protein